MNLPCLTEKQNEQLIYCGEQMALRYCAQVYVVGSALESEYPNDIDIYVAVKGDTYMRLFTNYGRKTESEEDHMANSIAMKVQQAKIYQKSKQFFEERIKAWDFDVKFQIIDQFGKHDGARIRLDEVYKEVW